MPESQTDYAISPPTSVTTTGNQTSHSYPSNNIQVKTAIVNLDGGANDNEFIGIIPNETEINKFPIQATINVGSADSVRILDATGVKVTNITLALADGTAVAGTFDPATQRWRSAGQIAGTSVGDEPTFGVDGNVVTVTGIAPEDEGTLTITGHFE